MLVGIIVSPEQELARQLEEALAQTDRVFVLQSAHRASIDFGLDTLLRDSHPDVVFIDVLLEPDLAVQMIKSSAPDAQVVAFGRDSDPDALLRVMRAGIREFIMAPFKTGALHETIHRCEEVRAASPHVSGPSSLFAFLPAKPGVGATTIAVNANLALARRKNSKPLLIDLDLASGMVGVSLQLHGQHSVVEAVENAGELEDSIWQKLVTKAGSLDVLSVTNYKYDYLIPPPKARSLLHFARRRYQTTSVDLSGMMELTSLEVLKAASRVFLVCTSELPVLHLAQKKIDILKSMGLEERTCVVLNRCPRDMRPSMQLVEKALGLPVGYAIPNDYRVVTRSVIDGKSVDWSSSLGKALDGFAATLLPQKEPKPAPAGLFGLFAPQKSRAAL
jgi:pilus assembly protein CpaE